MVRLGGCPVNLSRARSMRGKRISDVAVFLEHRHTMDVVGVCISGMTGPACPRIVRSRAAWTLEAQRPIIVGGMMRWLDMS